MPSYRIKLDQPIEADSAEEAADMLRRWLRNSDKDELYSPFIDVIQCGPEIDAIPEAAPIPMDITVFEWWQQSQSNFMPPQVDYFDKDPQEDRDKPSDDEAYGAGWYSRLLSDGFGLGTKWNGPHATKYLAMESLFNTHGE